MRTIKFRGKSVLRGRWFYGDLVTQDNMNDALISVWNPVSLQNDCYSVDPETVGEFTGLLDTNGIEIYEGDVVQWYSDIEVEYGTAPYGRTYKETVVYEGGAFNPVCHIPSEEFEVIGNIHEK